MFFDSHAHLTCDPVFAKIDAILARAKTAQVDHVANICIDPITLKRGIDLAKRYSHIYNVGATTPHDVEKEGEEAFPVFEEAAMNGQLVAIGETGLDYHFEHSKKALQQDFLKRYFELALKVDLPVVIHCRDAFDDLFKLADDYYDPSKMLVLHCFTGSMAEANEVIKRDWFLSLSGIVTFKRSVELRDVAKLTPVNQLLIETDTPYLAPVPHRGKSNEPAFIAETAKRIAEEKDLPLSELASCTSENAKRFFRIANSV